MMQKTKTLKEKEVFLNAVREDCGIKSDSG